MVGFSGGCQGVPMWLLESSRQLSRYFYAVGMFFECFLAHCYTVFMLCGLVVRALLCGCKWFLAHWSALTRKLLMVAKVLSG